MDISIFGLGYVGIVSAACLAKSGSRVIGVDTNQKKVEIINDGRAPIIEGGLEDLVSEAVTAGKLSATTDACSAVMETQLSLVCVGTPSQRNGSLDTSYVRNVCEQIAGALIKKQAYHLVVIRSTMLPGSMGNLVVPALEEFSGLRAGHDFGVCFNPEFLREGTAIEDYFAPPKTVIGQSDEKSGDLLAELYASIEAPLIRTDIATAEMVKYTDNAWHALKVAFANEIGNFCKETAIDSHRVMEIFCQDRKLNISPCYMKPGFAFGGSCLPKDLRALIYKAKSVDLDVPVLDAILRNNAAQVDRAMKMITSKGAKRISVLGFSFKAGTDDLRESPTVELIERLLGKGYDIRIYDRYVNLAKIMGANRDYILNVIPHISRLMVEDLGQAIDHAEVLVIGNSAPEFREVPDVVGNGKFVVDLVRVTEKTSREAHYDGICW